MSRERSAVRCIVCDKAITKRTQTMLFREAHNGYAAAGPFMAEIPAKPHGTREGVGYVTIYVNTLPRSIHDVQCWTNDYIMRAKPNKQGNITQVSTWDGERYSDRFFCSNKCATKQGYASANHGDRFTWRD